MLFDDITSALDVELVGSILALLRELAESGEMMPIVTHEMGLREQRVGPRAPLRPASSSRIPSPRQSSPRRATREFLASLL